MKSMNLKWDGLYDLCYITMNLWLGSVKCGHTCLLEITSVPRGNQILICLLCVFTLLDFPLTPCQSANQLLTKEHKHPCKINIYFRFIAVNLFSYQHARLFEQTGFSHIQAVSKKFSGPSITITHSTHTGYGINWWALIHLIAGS